MVYAYDQWAPLPTKDLYNTQLMLASINAAKDMYDKAEADVKEFNTKYGEFYSPIKKDVEWYNNNVIKPMQDKISDMYNSGIDPLRNPQARAELAMIRNRMPYDKIGQVKQSAKIAEAYLNARQQLQMKGLYNPDIEKYEGKSLDQYDTINDGIWTRTSPTPYQDLAEFSKSYFDGIAPSARDISRNGRRVSIEEITEKQLRDIAEQHYNDLVNTPQGRLMMLRDLDRAGGDKELARKMFNEEIYNANERRKYTKYFEDDHYFDFANLNLKNKQYNLEAAKFNYQKQRDRANDAANAAANASGKEGINLTDLALREGITKMVGNSSFGMRHGITSATQYNGQNAWKIMMAAAGSQEELMKKHGIQTDANNYGIRFTVGNKPSQVYKIKKVNGGWDWASKAPVKKGTGERIPLSHFMNVKSGKLLDKPGVAVKGLTLVRQKRNESSVDSNMAGLAKGAKAFVNENMYSFPTAALGSYITGKAGDVALDDIIKGDIFDITDVVANAHGSERTKTDIRAAREITRRLRNALYENAPKYGKDHLTVKCSGKAIAIIDKSGAVQNYAICSLYDNRAKKNLDKNGKIVEGGKYNHFLVKLPQKTQKIEGFGITHNVISDAVDNSDTYLVRTLGDNTEGARYKYKNPEIHSDPLTPSWQLQYNSVENPY